MKFTNWKAEKRAECATRVLSGYIETALTKRGVTPDSDIEAECADIVDDIVTAAVLETLSRLEKAKEAA